VGGKVYHQENPEADAMARAIVEQLRDAAMKSNYSASSIARITGMSDMGVRNFLNGEGKEIRLHTAVRLAHAVGLRFVLVEKKP
jgi:DNA-binding phage protein